MFLTLRHEDPADSGAIRAIHDRAFGQPQEGRLVDALREHGGVLLSLVAMAEGELVGHILYTPVSIAVGGKEVLGVGLGPMAVLPEFQRRGIGTRLVEAGNRKLREAGVPFIVVVGHPEYYPRFGFVPASKHELSCEWDVPDEVFMVLVTDRETMAGVSGLARYRAEFSSFA
jgi:putative acetyltransferase